MHPPATEQYTRRPRTAAALFPLPRPPRLHNLCGRRRLRAQARAASDCTQFDAASVAAGCARAACPAVSSAGPGSYSCSSPSFTLAASTDTSLLLPAPTRHARLLVLLRRVASSSNIGRLITVVGAAAKRPKPPLDCIGHKHAATQRTRRQPPSPATPPAGSPRRRTMLPGSARTAACRAAGGRSGRRCAAAWGGAGWQGQRAGLVVRAPPCGQAAPGGWL